MGLVIDNASIVILANVHNPSILHPYFLMQEKIVPAEWDWKEAKTVITGPISQVNFNEGFSITAEFEKLVFQENKTERIPDLTPLGKMAEQYVKTLQYTNYTALGVNISGHILQSSLEAGQAYIVDRFISSGKWKSYGNGPVAAGLRFIYTIDNIKLTLTIEAGELIRSNEIPQPVLVIQANYHRDRVGDGIEWLISGINDWKNDYMHYINAIQELVLI